MKTKEELSAPEEAKQLTDEEVKTVAGGIKVVVDDQTSWWRSIVDFFFNHKN